MSQWIEGVHYYINEDGLVVLTEKFHLGWMKMEM